MGRARAEGHRDALVIHCARWNVVSDKGCFCEVLVGRSGTVVSVWSVSSGVGVPTTSTTEQTRVSESRVRLRDPTDGANDGMPMRRCCGLVSAGCASELCVATLTVIG